MMEELQDRVSIELIDAGEHKDRVVLVLSKVKGLMMTPQQLINNTPCTVALNVPREPAEKLKTYLEKAGAMVMLEEGGRPAEKLMGETPAPSGPPHEISPDEKPSFKEPAQVAESEAPTSFASFPADETTSAAEASAGQAETFPLPDEPVPPELPEFEPLTETPENHQPQGRIQQLLTQLPWRKKTPASKVAMPISDTAPETPGERLQTADRPVKKIPDLFSHPVTFLLIGFLAGALIAGLWGMMEINRMKQSQEDYERETAQKIIQESATLKNLVQQRTQEAQTLQQKNSELEAQLASAMAQLQGAQPLQEIRPALSPSAMPSWEQELMQSFETVMKRHLQSLSKGYEAQKKAACSFQVLLDGNGTSGYAQIVKQFNTQYTLYDIRHNDSLLVPYIAEMKIPFQQEQKIEQTQQACQTEQLKRLETPDHHEFGEYYGYWTIEYQYRKGQWVVNQTVIERNRDLYENAFQKGSPDYAKFRIDTNLFPEFTAQP